MAAEWVRLGVMLLGVGIAIGQLWFISRQMKIIRKQVTDTRSSSRRQCSLGYSITRNDRLRDAIVGLENAFDGLDQHQDAIPLATIDERCGNDRTVYRNILSLLGHWENMALAIHADVADEDVCYEMVAGLVIDYVRVFDNFIRQRRDRNPRAYQYLMKLAHHWEERRRGIQMVSFRDYDPLKA